MRACSASSRTLHPAHLVEDAIRLNVDSYARHRVTIERHVDSTRTIAADRHKVLQILVNLLRNAKQAITEANPADRRVTIRIADTGADRISISVTDTGAGISPENVAKVFRHGFTTKKHGHGFGLHSSALTAREMNGQLSVHSDGPARGATFTLDLPTTLEVPTTRTA
jgi:C4-dicarboxylate-specific signal transduction histidine kinase